MSPSRLRVRTTAALAIAVVLALAGCSKGRPMDRPAADYAGYATVAEMAQASTFVIEGTPRGSEVEDIGLFGVTVYDVEVTAVHAGDIVGDVVPVVSSGGTGGYETDTDLTDGDTYLLFLTDRHDPDYFPLNPMQAVYRVTDGGYQSVEDDNSITVTADDLAVL